jgi:hypothetical protein
MNKLKLQAEELKVESFPTSHVDVQFGTVQGQELASAPAYLVCPLVIRTKPTDCPCTP